MTNFLLGNIVWAFFAGSVTPLIGTPWALYIVHVIVHCSVQLLVKYINWLV